MDLKKGYIPRETYQMNENKKVGLKIKEGGATLIVERKMMSHMFKLWLNGESQRGGCNKWLQHCCIQTCVEAQKEGRLPN